MEKEFKEIIDRMLELPEKISIAETQLGSDLEKLRDEQKNTYKIIKEGLEFMLKWDLTHEQIIFNNEKNRFEKKHSI